MYWSQKRIQNGIIYSIKLDVYAAKQSVKYHQITEVFYYHTLKQIFENLLELLHINLYLTILCENVSEIIVTDE